MSPAVVRRSREHDRYRRTDWIIAALLAVVPAVVSIGVAAAGHAWGIARTDDWAFARIAFNLHHSGAIRLVGWGQMNLLGLIAWAQPFLWVFGDHVWVLDLSVAVLVGAGLAAAFRLARTFLSPGGAAFTVVAVVAYPGFLRDTSTFMTDGPAFAIQAIVLALGVEAMSASGRRRVMLLAAVVGFGFWGFSVREFAIAAPLAVLGAGWFGADRQLRRRLLLCIVGFGVACGVFYLWRTGLPYAQAMNGPPGIVISSVNFSRALATTCFGLVPALLLTAKSWWHPVSAAARRRGCVAGASMVTFLMLTSRTGHPGHFVLLGDYLDPFGIQAGETTLGLRPRLLPPSVWAILGLAAMVATIVVAGLLGEWLGTRSARPDVRSTVLALHLVVFAGACGAAAALNGLLFDRYLWPCVLTGTILVLNRYRPAVPAWRTAGAWLAGAGLVALLLIANSASYDGARQSAGMSLTRQGLSAETVDAGFEWMGANAMGSTTAYGHYPGGGDLAWWATWIPHPTICALVTSSPIAPPPGFVLSGTRAWKLFLVAGPEQLSIYRRETPACGASS